MTVEVTDGLILGQYWRCKFSAQITNIGSIAATFNLWGSDNLEEEFGGPRTWGPQAIALAPGESYPWTVEYDIDFIQVPSPYTWELWGDWPSNNHSKGDARPENAVVNPDIRILSTAWDMTPPQYAPGVTAHLAAQVYNPTTRPWNYTGRIYIGSNEVAAASFSLNSGETADIPFSVPMPSAEGTYNATLKIYSDSMLVKEQSLGSVVTTYSWNFTGGLGAICVQYFDNPSDACYIADISYSINNPSAPNFKWVIIYWDYGWTNTYQRGGNGPASGTVRCSGGAILYAHPDPNAVLAGYWSEAGGFVQTSNFKEIARIGGHELGNI
jgi:hypothetical protein